MTVVTFEDYLPPERGDGKPWTQARIEEAPAVGGAWALIETVALLPVDADPTQPQLRTFTTESATLAAGWYRVTWVDGTGDASQPTPPVENAAPSGLAPSVAEVAALLRARTKDRGGREIGTFASTTRPTAAQVLDFIDEAVDDVTGKVGMPEPGSRLEARAHRAAALYAAVLVETSYFPEQVAQGRSPVEVYERLYESRIEALQVLMAAVNDVDVPDPETGAGDADLAFDTYWVDDAGQVQGRGIVGFGTDW